jgi:diguanylate cyclase (GGDEF)-like protein/PAS domain S-box-containing protein
VFLSISFSMKYFQSIRTQLLLAISITFFVFLLVAMGGVYLLQKEALTRESIKKVTELDNVLKAGLKGQMFTHNTALTQTLVDEIKAFKNVTDIYIINAEGVVKFSPDHAHVGNRLSKDRDECRSCHHDATGKKNLTLQTRNSHGASILRNVTHIYNEAACFPCHPAGQKILGLLFVDYSTADTDALISSTLSGLFLTVLAAFIIVSLVILYITNRLIYQPITMLIESTNEIKNGNYKQQIHYGGRTEFSILADSFNDMSEKLRIGRDQLEERINERTGELEASNERLVREITERKLVEKELQKSEELFRKIYVESPLGMAISGSDFHFRSANEAFCRILGYSVQELTLLTFKDLTHPDHITQDIEEIRKLLPGEIPVYQTDKKYVRKDGQIIWGMAKVSAMRGRDGQFEYFLLMFADITERKRVEVALQESEERYHALSIVDDLTLLYNSRHFYFQLKIELERSNRYGHPLTLLLLDIDNFKHFNDTYGHVEGDQVLRRLGQVIKRCLRETDFAYRYGGEEFTILLPMTQSADGAVTAERIRTEFKKEDFSPAPATDVHMTASIGLAQYLPQEDMKAFVHRVDQLMYQGKKKGKDIVCSEP